MKINPFVRCACGKIHVRTYITVTSKCVCGVNLWEYLWL